VFGRIAAYINASIGRRLALGMTSMLLAGLAVSTVLFMRDERHEMQEILYEKAKTALLITSSRLAASFEEGDLSNLDDELAAVVEDRDFDYAFVFKDDQLLGRAQDDGDPPAEPLQELPPVASLKPRHNVLRTGDHVMELLTPVVVKGENVAGFGLGVSLDLLSRQAGRLRLRLLLVTMMLVSSALVFIAWWTRKTVTPLHELQKGAEHFAGGDLSVRVTPSGIDEVGSLASTFNQLAESLQRTVEEKDRALRESNRLYRNLKVARAQLDRAERLSAVGMLAAGVSHELNNPLSIILSTAGNLREALGDGNPHSEDVAIIESETQRCRRIIQGLLNFAASGERHLAEIDLNSLLRDTFAIAVRDERARGLNAAWALDPNLPLLWVDALQIQQVFLNLLMNAADAMGGNGTIQVRTAESIEGGRRQVLIEFRDQGCGIGPGDLDHIFDPFFTTKKGGTGFGLGLAVSYGIIHAHGGEITVQSTLGQGSVFTITVPRRAEQPIPREAIRESK
jgi:signal transduction histidine kinase